MRAQVPCSIRLRTKPLAKSSGAPSSKSASSTRARREPSSEPAKQRFEALRQLRAKLAKETSVPPYVIAHDAALLAAAEQNPANLDALSDVYGWGPSRVTKYGDAVLSALRSA